MIVMDNGNHINTSIIIDKLQAWSGDYHLFKSDDNQFFLNNFNVL